MLKKDQTSRHPYFKFGFTHKAESLLLIKTKPGKVVERNDIRFPLKTNAKTINAHLPG